MKQQQATAPAFPQRRAARLPCAVMVMAWLVCHPAAAARPPAFLPARGDDVVETIPASYRTVSRHRIAPAPPTVDDVSTMIALAQRSGDARIAARAEAAVSHWPRTGAPLQVVLARAWLAQHRHDFASSMALLDAAVEQDERAHAARFMRAQVNLVRGNITAARSDCVAVALAGGIDEARLCAASVATRLGRHDEAARLLDARPIEPGGDAGLARYAGMLRAEIAARAGEDAAPRFERLVAEAPDDVAVLAAHARHLRTSGRAGEALELLQAHRSHDRLLLESALAARAARDPQAAVLAAQIEARYAQARQLELEPELRDEAEYWLLLGGDPARAYALARRNAVTQRDVEDVAILRAAGAASGIADPLSPLRSWAARESVPLGPAARWLEPL